MLDVMREEDRTENRTEIFLLAGHYVFTAVILSCCQPPLIPAGGLRRVRPVSPCTVRRAGQGGEDRPGPDAKCLRATVRSQEAGTWSGQYLDRSKTRAAVPADLTQHPALPVSLQPLFPLITIYRHDVEYLKFSCLNEIFRFDVVLGKKENIS